MTRALRWLLIGLIWIPSESKSDPIYGFGWASVSGSATMLTRMVDVYPVSMIPGDTPAAIAAETLDLPDGKRVLLMLGWENTYSLVSHAGDRTPNNYPGPWLTNGTIALSNAVKTFMTSFVAAGGDVDQVHFDYESTLTPWSMTSAQMRDIIADPRFSTFESEMSPWHSADAMSSEPAKMRFNALTHKYSASAMNDAEFGVVQSYFPGVIGTSYAHYEMNEETTVPDVNGHYQYGYSVVGTHNTGPFYGWMAQVCNFMQPGITNAPVKNPYNGLLMCVKTARAMRRTTSKELMPWIGYKSWTNDSVGHVIIGQTPYYDELIYHLALNGASGFLYFNPHAPYGTASDTDDLALDACLTNLAYLGITTTSISTTTNDLRWGADVIASGVKIDGSTEVWRISVPEGESEVAVYIGGVFDQTLTVAGGTAGVWFTNTVGNTVAFYLPSTAADNAPPTITISAPASNAPYVNVSPVPTATASDSDGSVVCVSFFYKHDFYPGNDWSAPYQKFYPLSTSGIWTLTAVATDDDGAIAMVSTNITITESSPTVATSSATVGALTATVNASVSSFGGTFGVTRGFQYGPTASYGLTTTNTSLYGVNGAWSEILNGLSVASTYHYRAYVVNAAGIGYGSDQTFTTESGSSTRSTGLRLGNLKGR